MSDAEREFRNAKARALARNDQAKEVAKNWIRDSSDSALSGLMLSLNNPESLRDIDDAALQIVAHFARIAFVDLLECRK